MKLKVIIAREGKWRKLFLMFNLSLMNQKTIFSASQYGQLEKQVLNLY